MNLAHDYYDANLALLEKHHPAAWQAVVESKEKPLGEFCSAGDGKINLLVHGKGGEDIFIHDPVCPETELGDYYALVPEDTTGVVFFIGMGLGYSPLAMLRSRRQARHVAILEPEMGIFLQALRAMDLAALFTDRRVLLALGAEIDVEGVTLAMERALLLENVHILNHLPSLSLNPAVYQGLYDEVYKTSNSSNVGGATTRMFGRKFIENRFRHLTAIHHQDLLEHLGGAFVGVPAIIVAGGPSLNKNIHLLEQAKGKAVVIAVDTVLPALLAHGIVPDFTTSIDMQDIVLEKIVDVSAAATQTSLVCASWVSPLIPKRFPARQVYWTFAAKAMEGWLNTLVGGEVLTGGAGTVAHLSFTAAVSLGCSPIVFVGQDLAYTNMEDHAQYTSLTQKDDLARYREGNELQWVDGYGGQKVQTSRGWLSDKHYFEWAMAANADRKFINATEGGVRLDGAEELPLREVLARFCREEVDKESVLRVKAGPEKLSGRRKMIEEFKRQLKIITVLEKDMDRLGFLATKLGREIARLARSERSYTRFDSLPVALRQQINELDLLNKKLDKASIWTLLEEVTLDGLQESERLMHNIQELADSQEGYLAWIGKSIERFVFINQCRRQVLLPFRQSLKQLHDHLQKENLLLERLAEAGEKSPQTIFELLQLYFRNEDYMLMDKLIASSCPNPLASAELCFYLGVIAANQSQFEKAEEHFSRAVDLDPLCAERIAVCRQRLGDQYFAFGREWQGNDRDVARRMLFKGIRHCGDHPALQAALGDEAAQMLTEVELAVAQGKKVEGSARLAAWCRELAGNVNLARAIGPERAAALCRCHGNAMVVKQEYAKAIEAFAVAIAYTPHAPDLYLLQADGYFALEDFPHGVACLDRAVGLDRTYAKYWENMGDNLQSSGQQADALAAYEKCFTSLPEEIGLLKKIGDCYLALEQPEAALEAYKQFKVRVLGSVPEARGDQAGRVG